MKRFKKWQEFVKDYLARAFHVHEKDWQKLFYLSLLNFIMMFGNTVGSSIATSLFLKNTGIESLPVMYIANSLLISAGSLLYFPFISRFRQTLVLKYTFLVFTFLILIARLAAAWHINLFYPVLYLLSILFVWVYYTQFWTLAIKICNIREGKRIFSFVVSAGLLGGGTGGALTKIMMSVFRATDMLFIWALAFFIITLVIKYCEGLFISSQETLQNINTVSEQILPSKKVFEEFRRSRLLRAISSSFFLFAIVVYLLDFHFNYQANSVFPTEDRLAGFLGTYYGYFYAGTLILVLTAAPYIIRSIGIGNVMLTLPLAIGIGFFCMNFRPGFVSVVVVKFIRDVIGNSLIESTYPLIFLPLSETLRRESLTFNESLVIPAGTFIAGLLIILFRHIPGPEQIILTGTVLSAAWIYFSLQMKKHYIQAFVQAIEDRTYFERENYLQELTDLGKEKSMKILKSALYEQNEKVSIFAMETLIKTGRRQAVEILLEFLQNKNIDGRRRASAILALGESGNLITASELSDFLKDPDPRIRANAIESIGKIDPVFAKNLAKDLLNDQNSRVRTNAAVILWKYGEREEGLKTLSEMAKDTNSENRVRVLYALSELGGVDILPIVTRMVEDENEEVRLYVVKALERVNNKESISLLIKMLGDKSRVVRRSVSRVLEKMDGMVSRLLFEAIKSAEDLVKKEIAFLIMNRKDPGLIPVLEEYCTQEIKLIYETFYRIYVLSESRIFKNPGDEHTKEICKLLLNSMKLRCERKLFKVLRLISAVEYSHTFTIAVRRLRDRYNPEARANAIEVIEGVMGRNLVDMLLPLLEDTTIYEKVREGIRVWNFREIKDIEILKEMSQNEQLKGQKLCAQYILDRISMD